MKVFLKYESNYITYITLGVDIISVLISQQLPSLIFLKIRAERVFN